MEANLPLNKNKALTAIPQIILIIAIIWFSITFIIWPIINVILQSFIADGEFSLLAVQKILNSNRAMDAIKNSLFTGIVIMFTTTFIGVLQVLITDYFDVKGANILRIAYMAPLVFGGLVLNNGYLYVYGETGIVTQFLMRIFPNLNPNWFSGAFAVIFVMTFGCTHQYMIFFRNAINNVDNNIIEAAKNLGSGQFEILRKVVFPTVRPTLTTLMIITFQTGINAFAAPLMVGGKDFQTISPLILTFAQRPKSRDLASVLSIFLGISQILLLAFMTWNESRGNYISVSKSKARLRKQKIENPIVKIIIYVIAIILFIIHALPAIMIFISSFMKTEAISRNIFGLEYFTLDHYKTVLTSASNYGPLLRSILYSGLAAIASVFLMLILVRFIMNNRENHLIQSLEYPFYIPWLVPSIMIALGYLTVYDRPHPLLFGQSVIGSKWILPISYIIVVIPSTLRYVKSAYYNFDTNLEDASKNLGAGTVRTFFQVILPALLPTALALIALNFNTNLSEYNMSAFLYPPGGETLGIVIRQNASSVTNVDAKAINMVYSVILTIISSIVIYFVYGRGTELGHRRSGLASNS